MSDAAESSSSKPKQGCASAGIRIYGMLAIAFGVLQASLLVLRFPPSPRLAPGIYFGIALGLLGIPVFLLQRWAAVLFFILCIASGCLVLYAVISSGPTSEEWAFAVWAAAILVVPPAFLLWACRSPLR